MFKLFSGIWFLDCIDLIKYNGIDVFDSILNIHHVTWVKHWLIIICIVIVLTAIKTLLDSK
jgi:hypothetical protein